MLKKFSLRNYKNFKDEVSLDFCDTAGSQFNNDCITDGIISKMLIYGRNATGKTNLGRALVDIFYILFGGLWHMEEGAFLHADSVEDAAVFSYTFQFEKHEVVYQYARFANYELKEEKLFLNNEMIYACDFLQEQYDFEHLSAIDVETASTERYRQSLSHFAGEAEEETEYQIPFLRWLVSNMVLNSGAPLRRLADYVRGMSRMTVRQEIGRKPNRMYNTFFESLEDLDALADFEAFLNAMGIGCKLTLKKLPDDQQELYFVHNKLVPFFENASSGTLALVELYRRFVAAGRNATLLYLDEFDAFYHYEMAENIVRFFKEKYPKCQIIMTTHNTNLMTNRLMRPDCLFILSTEGKLTALCNATQRELREGHNLEKMYISGEFEKYE